MSPRVRGLRVSLLVILLLVTLAEIGVRIFVPATAPPPLRFRFLNRMDADVGEEGKFQYSDTLFWTLRPGAPLGEEQINAHGMRSPEVGLRDGAFRLAVLGDSCTFGSWVEYEEAYGTKLARMLADRLGRPVELLNAGVPGYSIVQGRQRFEEDVVPLAPDGAVLYFGAWNDFNPAMGDGRNDLALARGEGSDAEEWLYGLLCNSRLFELMALRYAGTVRYRRWRSTMDQWLVGDPPHGYRVPLRDFEVLFAEFLDRCDELGLPVVVVLPELNGSMRHLNAIYWGRLEEYRQVMRAATTERGLPLVDQRELYAGESHADLYVDIVHPSAEGHEHLARALAERIVQAGWFD